MRRRAVRNGRAGERRAPGGRFTRLRALLAGALVLGVGATLTLASWTDTEVARGSFAASTFGIEGSTNGTAYAEHPSASAPAELSFAVSPTAMSPGTTVYARYLVRTTQATNVAGTAQLSAATVSGSGLGTYLTYGVRVIAASAECTQATYTGSSTVVVPAGSALTTGAAGTQALATGGGSPVAYCFAVTLPTGTSNAAQGLTATATWTITATSAS